MGYYYNPPKQAMSKPATRTQGAKWIRREKRLAIYLRDGLACAYCGASLEDGMLLTLDHIKPYTNGGSNHESNLVTCCHKCNSSRADRPVAEFARAVAEYVNHGVTAEDILCHVNNTRRRKLDVTAAKRMITRRGGYAAAIDNLMGD